MRVCDEFHAAGLEAEISTIATEPPLFSPQYLHILIFQKWLVIVKSKLNMLDITLTYMYEESVM